MLHGSGTYLQVLCKVPPTAHRLSRPPSCLAVSAYRLARTYRRTYTVSAGTSSLTEVLSVRVSQYAAPSTYSRSPFHPRSLYLAPVSLAVSLSQTRAPAFPQSSPISKPIHPRPSTSIFFSLCLSLTLTPFAPSFSPCLPCTAYPPFPSSNLPILCLPTYCTYLLYSNTPPSPSTSFLLLSSLLYRT